MRCTGMTASQFNNAFPVGTPVRYFSIIDEAEFIESKTRSEAWQLGHGASVVLIEGKSGGKLLDAIETIDPEAN